MRHAAPALLDAARWALYAERMMPMLRAYETVQGTPLPVNARAKAEAAPIRIEANRQIELIRAVLFPDG